MPRYPVRPTPTDQSAPGGVVAVDRALQVLTAFSETEPALLLSELSERTQLVPSTTLRMLISLMHFGFVQKRTDGRYTLGPAAAQLQRVHAAAFNLESLVMPALRALTDQTQESASFHVRQGKHRIVLYRVNSPHPLTDQSRTGDLLPLKQGSGGHVLMAFSGAVGPLYDRIRQQGYTTSPVSDRSVDLAGISAAVLDAHETLVGTVTLTMPVQRYDDTHIARVCATAAQLTRELGGSAHHLAATEPDQPGTATTKKKRSR